MTTLGVDASRWQGLLNWRRLRDRDIRFAGLRATMGQAGVDPLYVAQRAAVEREELLLVSYGLLYPRPGTGAAQARFLAETAGGDAILAGDVEPPDGFPAARASVWREVVYDFTCEASKLSGMPPLIYGSPSFLRALELPADMWGAPLWLADWRDRVIVDAPAPWRRITIRQTGLAPASISATPLDFDRYEGTLDELRREVTFSP